MFSVLFCRSLVVFPLPVFVSFLLCFCVHLCFVCFISPCVFKPVFYPYPASALRSLVSPVLFCSWCPLCVCSPCFTWFVLRLVYVLFLLDSCFLFPSACFPSFHLHCSSQVDTQEWRWIHFQCLKSKVISELSSHQYTSRVQSECLYKFCTWLSPLISWATVLDLQSLVESSCSGKK